MDLMKKHRRRWWLQFSLRSLLIAILVVAAYLAGWRSAESKAERDKQQAIREALKEYQAAFGGHHGQLSFPVGSDGIPDLEGLISAPSPQEQVQRFMELQKFFRDGGTKQRKERQVDEGNK